jgi:hypothetical protein
VARPERATREFVRILQLHARYEEEILAQALEQALCLGCWSADGVEYLARQTSMPAWTALPSAAHAGSVDPLSQVGIPLPDLARFDVLLRGAGA